MVWGAGGAGRIQYYTSVIVARLVPPVFTLALVHTVGFDEWMYLDRVSQRNGDGERQALWDSHHQHSDPDDEKLHKVLDVDRSALRQPNSTCNTMRPSHSQSEWSTFDASVRKTGQEVVCVCRYISTSTHRPSTTNVLMTKNSTRMMTVMADITKPVGRFKEEALCQLAVMLWMRYVCV